MASEGIDPVLLMRIPTILAGITLFFSILLQLHWYGNIPIRQWFLGLVGFVIVCINTVLTALCLLVSLSLSFLDGFILIAYSGVDHYRKCKLICNACMCVCQCLSMPPCLSVHVFAFVCARLCFMLFIHFWGTREGGERDRIQRERDREKREKREGGRERDYEKLSPTMEITKTSLSTITFPLFKRL